MNENVCLFCLDSSSQILKLDCCNTYYHDECLLLWKNHNSKNKNYNPNDYRCPICKTSIIDKLYNPLQIYNMPYTFYKFDLVYDVQPSNENSLYDCFEDGNTSNED